MYTLTSREFQGKSPVIHEEAFVAPQVFLSGDVRVARFARIWPVLGSGAARGARFASLSASKRLEHLVAGSDKFGRFPLDI